MSWFTDNGFSQNAQGQWLNPNGSVDTNLSNYGGSTGYAPAGAPPDGYDPNAVGGVNQGGRDPGPSPDSQAARALAITNVYQQSLGRTPSQSEIAQWIGNDNYVAGIQGSPEAQQYAKTGQAALASTNFSGSESGGIIGPGGIQGMSNSGGGSGSLDAFTKLLAANPGNPQAAISQFNQQYPNDPLAPMWEPGSKTVGLANGTYLVQPGTGGNGSSTDWQTVQRGDESGGGGSLASQYGLNSTPFSYTPFQTPAPFVPPSASDVYNDPVVQAQLQLGMKALQSSAASKGTLLTTGTLDDLNQFAQQVGATYGNDVYTRAANTYSLNTGTALNANAQQFNQALGANNQNFGQGLQSGYYGLAGQNQQFTQGYNLANLGLNATESANANALGYAGLTGSTLGNLGNNLSNLTTGSGNAQAAGQVASGNASNSYLSNLANNASYLNMLYHTGYGT